MQLADLDINGTYTYANYLKWTFEERIELIKGKLFKMSPAANPSHQRISAKLLSTLHNYLEGKTCEVFHAPFDVRFPTKSKEDVDIITVLQPDLCVICDASKIDEKGCLGAPDIVVEILSPSNSKKELKFKYQVYQESGVLEYWVVIPTERFVTIYTLVNGVFVSAAPLTDDDVLTSSVLPGFSISVSDLFSTIKNNT
jgi:Uma2 family endonuclease